MKFPSLEDYILIEQTGKTGRLKLASLEGILLPIAEGGPIEDLESEIDEMKLYLENLSADFAATHQTISELNKLYEQKTVTDYMQVDPNILKSETINKFVTEANMVTIDEVENAYSADETLTDKEFLTASSKIDKWMY